MIVPAGERHPWILGASEEGVVVGEYLAGAFRVVALGPAAGRRSLDPRFAEVARELLEKELRGAVPLDVPSEELRRLVRRVDRGVRTQLPGGSDARATMVCAMMSEGQLWCAHTGEGSVYRLRDGHLECLVRALPDSLATRAQRSRMARSAGRGLLGRHHRLNPGDVPWIGPRSAEDERQPVMVRLSAEALGLQEGDRLLFCTTAPTELAHIEGLEQVVGEGQPELAAQAICNVLAMRDGLGDVAVAVLDWGKTDFRVERNTSIDSLGADLFADFEELITEITDELDIEPPTPAPAPHRVAFSDAPQPGEAVLYVVDGSAPEQPVGEEPVEPPPPHADESVTEPQDASFPPPVEDAPPPDDELVRDTEPVRLFDPNDDAAPGDLVSDESVVAAPEPATPSPTPKTPVLVLVAGVGLLALLGLAAGTALAFSLL